MFYFGADYYPEHLPENCWAEDARLMQEAGFNVVRMAEFAWSLLEPYEGVFDFDWLDRAIAILGERGIKTVLGTPTASTPPWLFRPEVALVDAGPLAQVLRDSESVLRVQPHIGAAAQHPLEETRLALQNLRAHALLYPVPHAAGESVDGPVGRSGDDELLAETGAEVERHHNPALVVHAVLVLPPEWVVGGDLHANRVVLGFRPPGDPTRSPPRALPATTQILAARRVRVNTIGVARLPRVWLLFVLLTSFESVI